MKRIVAIALCVIIALSVTACDGGSGLSAGSEMTTVRQYYREASLVVSGVCTERHTDAAGRLCHDVEVDAVLAGDAAVGDVVHCSDTGMTEGGEYLLYLSVGGDADYAEDIQGYTIVSGQPLLISGGSVVINGVAVPVEDIIADINENLSRVITAPADRYYYSKLAELTAAADDIFIGVVSEFPTLDDTVFSSREAGQGSENTLPASMVKIRALGTVKGSLSYGDSVTLVYAPELAKEIIDASTLVPLSGGADSFMSLRRGETYLFFLIRSTDAKQSYFFTVNPIQGYIHLDGEALAASEGNQPVRGYYTLTNLIRAMKRFV